MSKCVCAQISMRVREFRGITGKPSPAIHSISNPTPVESRIISPPPPRETRGFRGFPAGWEPVQASNLQ